MKVKNDHRSKFSNLSNWKKFTEDHSSLSRDVLMSKLIRSHGRIGP